MAEICQRVIDGFGMPVELIINIVVPFLRGRVTSETGAALEL